MQFTYDNQSINIDIPDNSKKIGIMMSGGLDSSLLAALCALEIKNKNLDCIIQPVTWKRPYPKDQPLQWNLVYSANVIKYIKENVNDCFAEQYIFSPLKEEKLTQEEEFSELKRLEAICKEELGLDNLLYGTTANPPYEEMKNHDLIEGREKHRDKELDHTHETHCNPFSHIDKRFIKFLYEENNLIELAKITRSCEGWPSATANFTKPCYKCWWCKEKYWGFGFY